MKKLRQIDHTKANRPSPALREFLIIEILLRRLESYGSLLSHNEALKARCLRKWITKIFSRDEFQSLLLDHRCRFVESQKLWHVCAGAII